jgi:hypothetical protein
MVASWLWLVKLATDAAPDQMKRPSEASRPAGGNGPALAVSGKTQQYDREKRGRWHPGCGLIGAFSIGCGATAVQPSSWGRIKAFHR